MRFVRSWGPSFVVGLLVAFLAVGCVEVAGVADTRQARTAAPPVSPDVREAALDPVTDSDMTDAERERSTASPTTSRTPAPTRTPVPSPRRTATPSAAPRPVPTTDVPRSHPTPTVTPRPAPTRSAAPAPIAPVSAAPQAPVAPPLAPTVAPTRTPLPLASPTPNPAPSPTRRPPAATPTPKPTPKPVRPADALDLSRWKLTLPTGSDHRPTEVLTSALQTFAGDAHFRLDRARTGVVFRAPVGGVTTKNSSYPRSELREMGAGGAGAASWSNRSGTHLLTVTQAITHVPKVKPHVVSAQIHDAEDDVVMVRLEGRRLFVESRGEDVGVLDPNYQLGRRFTIRILASPSGVRVVYNARRQVVVRINGTGWYFKAGCYVQSNPSRGDAPTAYGEVVIYALSVQHSGP